MRDFSHEKLTRREREIMDALYKIKKGTAADILANLSGDRNYSTVRAQLRTLEEKGQVHHEEQGLRYIYYPSVEPDHARRSALRHLRDVFFEGSTEKVVMALLGENGQDLSAEDLQRLSKLIKQAEKERRQRKEENL